MQKEEHQSLAYKFTPIDGISKTYVFQTKKGVIYEAIFRPSGYIFPEQPERIQQNIFEFSVTVLENPDKYLPAPDTLIPKTIAAIFYHFFENQNRVAVYIRDTADMRASARFRKFNQWYEWYGGEDFFKVDLTMGRNDNNEKYFTSLILHSSNPDATAIVEAFFNLVTNHNK